MIKETRRIDYDINTKIYLTNLFSSILSGEELEEQVKESNPIHMIFSQIGYDEEQNGQKYHNCNRYEMYDIDKKENFWCSDERVKSNTIKELMWLCQDHFSSWNNKKLDNELKEKGITWKESKVINNERN